MKTAASAGSRIVTALLSLSLCATASWNLSADADARLRASGPLEREAMLHVAGVSLRKTISDAARDRLILFGLIEAERNASEIMAHELYAKYKGPMGVWNITAGRFGVPFGLLVNFSTTRLPYRGLDEKSIGFDVDNGIMASGTAGMVDYAAAATQGYGPHHPVEFGGKGMGSGRIGVTFGESEEYNAGVSMMYARAGGGHDGSGTLRRALAGVDATAYAGRALARFELDAGTVGAHPFAAAFCAVDFALAPKFDLTAAGSYARHGDMADDYLYFGLTCKPRWITIRGGYRYAYHGTPGHEVSLQLYRLFAWNF